jgi:hypothetical protein
MALIDEIRWARKALATSLESSLLQWHGEFHNRLSVTIKAIIRQVNTEGREDIIAVSGGVILH